MSLGNWCPRFCWVEIPRHEFFLDISFQTYCTFGDKTTRLSPNVRHQLPSDATSLQKKGDLNHNAAKA